MANCLKIPYCQGSERWAGRPPLNIWSHWPIGPISGQVVAITAIGDVAALDVSFTTPLDDEADQLGFGKQWFCPLPKTGDFDENGENDKLAFYTNKGLSSSELCFPFRATGPKILK